MGSFDDSTPKVHPLGEETPPPTPGLRTVVGVATLVVVAFVAIYLSTGQSAQVPDAALPRVSTTTTTTLNSTTTVAEQPGADLNPSARMNRLLDEGTTFGEAFPEGDSEFVVVLAAANGADLVRVSRERSFVQLDLPIWDLDPLAFDNTGQHMAFIGTLRIGDDLTLFVGSDPPVPIAQNAATYEWHATIGGRISWIADGPQPQLCWADIVESDNPIEPECVPGPALRYQLVGFDENGFLAIDHAGRSIVQIGLDGGIVASVTGDDVARGPTGTTLIVVRDPRGERTEFTTTDAQFSNPQRLEWAPPNATGSPVGAAWSPSVAYPEIAFLAWENDQFQLQVWDLDGNLNHSIDLPGRLWGLEWDTTGRYILIPGALNETSPDGPVHILYAYDTSMDRMATLPFGGAVRQVALVTRASCEDANRMTEAFARRLAPDVALHSAQLMKSRDAYLLEFSFLSGVVSGGPHDGAIATWALPGYWPSAEGDPPDRVVAINEPARSLNVDTMDDAFEIDDWMRVDGAIGSQLCITGPPDRPTLP